MKVLITGGAGFIGTHLTRRLLRDGHAVTIVDSFSPQVHCGNKELSSDLAREVQLIRGDVRDESVVRRSLEGQEAVVHLAAETGTGQSMYEIARYEDVNLHGTAILLEQLVKGVARTVETVVVASSRAVYGEGRYRCAEHGVQFPGSRAKDHMRRGEFEPKCRTCGAEMEAVATTEESALHPSSFYGLTKLAQEQMILMFGRTLGLRSFGLRYQNVYGPGQSLNNPYTGILAVFSTQARTGKPIYVFEDGLESRDFVYVDDVVEATVRSLSAPTAMEALNVGAAQRVSVLEVAKAIVKYYGNKSEVSINGAFREGDIRHNFADLSRVAARLGYKPRWTFAAGLQRFLDWSADQTPQTNRYEESLQELKARGLYIA